MPPLPGEVRNQIEQVKNVLLEKTPAVLGVYLHGSICLDGFVPGRSDIDLLVLSEAAMNRAERAALADALLPLHERPCPIELSVARLEDAQRVPVLCQFHFSGMWAARYAAHDPTNPLLEGAFPDDDMPCHIRLTRQSGIALYGPPPRDVLPEIPDEVFWRSITYDAGDFAFSEAVEYDILTLARIVSFAHTRRILTKLQSAEWAAARFPAFAPLLRRAAAAYRLESSGAYADEELEAYRRFMLEEIGKGL